MATMFPGRSNRRVPFDRDRDFVTLRPLPAGGRSFGPGELFDKSLVTTRRLKQLYEQRYLGIEETVQTAPQHSPAKQRRKVKRIHLTRKLSRAVEPVTE